MNKLLVKFDNLIPYERAKHYLVTLALAGLCVFIGCSVWLTSEATLTLRTFRQSTLKDADYKERLAGVLSQAQDDLVKVGLLVDEGTVTVKEARMRLNSSLSTLNLDLQTLSPLAAEFRGLVADSRIRMGANLDELLSTQKGVTSLLGEAKPQVVGSLTNLNDITLDLKRHTEQLYAFLERPEVVQFVDDALEHGRSIIARFDEATGNLEVISENGRSIFLSGANLAGDVEKFVHSYLNSKPKWYQKWILTPLKAALGYGLTAYEITKR